MNGLYTQIHLEPDYAQAIGLAAYCFARCEWMAVYCCERICPGARDKIVADKMTAGGIAKHFVGLARNMPRSAGREGVIRAAEAFADLIDLRNAIIHAKGCTSPDGDQRLSSKSYGVFEIADLERAAADFRTCDDLLNGLYHEGFLSTYNPPKP